MSAFWGKPAVPTRVATGNGQGRQRKWALRRANGRQEFADLGLQGAAIAGERFCQGEHTSSSRAHLLDNLDAGDRAYLALYPFRRAGCLVRPGAGGRVPNSWRNLAWHIALYQMTSLASFLAHRGARKSRPREAACKQSIPEYTILYKGRGATSKPWRSGKSQSWEGRHGPIWIPFGPWLADARRRGLELSGRGRRHRLDPDVGAGRGRR